MRLPIAAVPLRRRVSEDASDSARVRRPAPGRSLRMTRPRHEPEDDSARSGAGSTVLAAALARARGAAAGSRVTVTVTEPCVTNLEPWPCKLPQIHASVRVCHAALGKALFIWSPL